MRILKSRKGQRAFSLVELMIAIAVMSILLAIGVTRFRSSQVQTSFNGEVEECIAAIQDTSNLGKSCRFLEINNKIVKQRDSPKTGGNNASIKKEEQDEDAIVWRIWQNGALVRGGRIGSNYSNMVEIKTRGFSSSENTQVREPKDVQQGAVFELSSASGTLCIPYMTDGTPLCSGQLSFRLYNGKNVQKEINVEVNIHGKVMNIEKFAG